MTKYLFYSACSSFSPILCIRITHTHQNRKPFYHHIWELRKQFFASIGSHVRFRLHLSRHLLLLHLHHFHCWARLQLRDIFIEWTLFTTLLYAYKFSWTSVTHFYQDSNQHDSSPSRKSDWRLQSNCLVQLYQLLQATLPSHRPALILKRTNLNSQTMCLELIEFLTRTYMSF